MKAVYILTREQINELCQKSFVIGYEARATDYDMPDRIFQNKIDKILELISDDKIK